MSGFENNTTDQIKSLAFSANSKYLACGTFRIHVLEVSTMKQLHDLPGHTAFIRRLAFDRSGSTLISGCNDSHIGIWTMPSGQKAA
ncbi:MAG: hypothetical protein M3Q12_13590, partial [Pseudomonadota bacterium]|nr:hypothetical protein [Pseudomonadota bacterium]